MSGAQIFQGARLLVATGDNSVPGSALSAVTGLTSTLDRTSPVEVVGRWAASLLEIGRDTPGVAGGELVQVTDRIEMAALGVRGRRARHALPSCCLDLLEDGAISVSPYKAHSGGGWVNMPESYRGPANQAEELGAAIIEALGSSFPLGRS